jgi:hypothetical protein
MRRIDLTGYDPDGADWTPLTQPRWLAWRYVKKNPGEKPKKVPLSVNGGLGSSTDPRTWGTRAKAERRGGDGLGFALGYVADEGEYICGIDLDGCLNGTGDVTSDLARKIIQRFDTYAEASPSGHGVHLLFTARPEDVQALGLDKKARHTIKPGAGGHDEIALDVDRRYYTVTGDYYEGRRTIRRMDRKDLEWLLSLATPPPGGGGHSRDETASGEGDRFFMRWYNKHGDDYEGALKAIMAHKGRAGDWARRVDQRQHERAWEDATKRVDEPPPITGGVTFFNTIDEEKVQWLRPSWPRGTVVMVAGESGAGKSTALYNLIARISRGLSWPPKEKGEYDPEVVLLLNYEDDSKVLIKPRLRIAGADMSKVALINRTKEGEKQRPFSIAEDLPLLEKYIADYKPAMVVIDPVSAFMGRTGRDHSRSGPDVRATLDPLAELAQRTGTTIVMVSHFRKSGSDSKHINPLYLVIDSQAYTALPRVVWMVAKDPDDLSKEHRFMLTAKNQYLKEGDWLHLGFKLLDQETVSRVKWDDDPPNVTVQEVIGHRGRGRPESARTDAKAHLQDWLKNGPVPVSTIRERAQGYNLNERTLYYARDDLEVDSCTIDGEICWTLGGKK